MKNRLGDLRDSALRAFPGGEWANYGPDAPYRTIRLVCANGEIGLHTWHPGAEQNPNLVAAPYGLTALDGKSRDEFLRSDGRAYVVKRDAFDDIEQRLILRFKGQ